MSASWKMTQYGRALGSYWPTARALTTTNAASVLLFLALLSIPVRKRLFGRGPKRLRIAPGGKSLNFYVRDGVDISVLREMFIDKDYEITNIEQPTHVVDLGAHIGAATLFFCIRYPNAQITSYEPDPENFILLKRNLSAFSTVKCVNAAVAAKSGSVTLYKHKGGSTRGTLSVDPDTVGEIIVPAVLFEETVQDGVDIVKFDVEGAEYNLFAAAPLAARQKVKLYTGEFHAGLTGKTPAEFEALFPGFSFMWKNEAMVTIRRN